MIDLKSALEITLGDAQCRGERQEGRRQSRPCERVGSHGQRRDLSREEVVIAEPSD